MPRKSEPPGQRAFASRIGLRGLCTTSNDDMDAHPGLRQFWTRAEELADQEYMLHTYTEIRDSPDILRVAMQLFEQYAPQFWSRPADNSRPWLYKPDEGFLNFPRYPRDLYYDDEDDRKVLRRNFIELVIAKVTRKHKDHYRRSVETMCSLPFAFKDVFGRRGRLPVSAFMCFDPSDPSQQSHNGGAWLYSNKIWLGSFDHVHSGLNGPSLMEVLREEIVGSDASRTLQDANPTVTNELPALQDMAMKCWACALRGRRHTTPGAQIFEVQYVDPKTGRSMQKWIWRYPCYFNGKRVFALLSAVSPELQDSLECTMPLWRFWPVNGEHTLPHDGAHTERVCLAQSAGQNSVNTSDQSDWTVLNFDQEMREVQPDRCPALTHADTSSQFGRNSVSFSDSIASNGNKRSRDSSSPRNAADLLRSFQRPSREYSHNSTASEVRASPKRFKVPSPGRTPHMQRNSDPTTPFVDDRMEDSITVKAGPSRNRIGQPGVGTEEAYHNISNARAEAGHTHSTQAGLTKLSSPPPTRRLTTGHPSSTAKPPELPLGRATSPSLGSLPSDARVDFRLRVTQRHTPNKRIVIVSDRMSVEDLFDTLQQRFDPIADVDGRRVITIALDVPDKTSRWHIVRDDSDSSETWTEVVYEMKTSDSRQFDGVIDVEK